MTYTVSEKQMPNVLPNGDVVISCNECEGCGYEREYWENGLGFRKTIISSRICFNCRGKGSVIVSPYSLVRYTEKELTVENKSDTEYSSHPGNVEASDIESILIKSYQRLPLPNGLEARGSKKSKMKPLNLKIESLSDVVNKARHMHGEVIGLALFGSSIKDPAVITHQRKLDLGFYMFPMGTCEVKDCDPPNDIDVCVLCDSAGWSTSRHPVIYSESKADGYSSWWKDHIAEGMIHVLVSSPEDMKKAKIRGESEAESLSREGVLLAGKFPFKLPKYVDFRNWEIKENKS